MLQFLTESILLVMAATGMAVILYGATRNLFGRVIGSAMPSLTDFPVFFWLFPIGLSLLIGIMAGIYPAFVLSRLNAVDSLKKQLKVEKDKADLRKSLVAFQFATAAIVLICAMIITQQINLFFSRGLGYNKDFIVSAQVARDWSQKGEEHMEFVRNEFEKVPGVKGTALSYEIPNGNNSGTAALYNLGGDSSQAISSLILMTDDKYLSVFQIPLLAGKDFSGGRGDSTDLMINKTAARQLGYITAKEAIGHYVKLSGDPRTYIISGVTNDFHFGSMQQKVAPVIISAVNSRNIYRYLSFKIKPAAMATTLDHLQKKWTTLMPDTPFEYRFMEDYLRDVYDNEIRLKRAAYTATGLALAIALISVIGIIALNIQRRTKEIGLRKVLGASAASIICLFLKDFIKIILISGVIATPAALLFMHKWLDGYAYKITITGWPFVATVFILLISTALLIILQTWKTAEANPVKSLKTE